MKVPSFLTESSSTFPPAPAGVKKRGTVCPGGGIRNPRMAGEAAETSCLGETGPMSSRREGGQWIKVSAGAVTRTLKGGEPSGTTKVLSTGHDEMGPDFSRQVPGASSIRK